MDKNRVHVFLYEIGKLIILAVVFLLCRSVMIDADEAGFESIYLLFDDRYLFKSPVSEIVQDSMILKTDAENPCKVCAVECGSATVLLENGTSIDVTVGPAPITMVLIAGQSNGEGRPSKADQIWKYKEEQTLCQEGTVYGSYGPSDEYGQDMYREVAWYSDDEGIGHLSVENALRFIPQSLTDNTLNDRYCKTNRLTDAIEAGGKGGMDAAFGWKWYSLTGEKVWVVNAAHHGCKIETWDPTLKRSSNYAEAVAMFQGAERVLEKEIKAGHFVLKHKVILWNQGENNRKMPASEYLTHLVNVKEGLWKDLSGAETMSEEHIPDCFGIIMVRSGTFDTTTAKDFTLTGPRAAQYYAVCSDKYPDIYLASQVREEWESDETIRDYFAKRYGSEEAYNEAYPKHAEHIVMPTTVREVRESIHYTQLAYNEIGIDAAENMCIQMGYIPQPEPDEIRIIPVAKDGVTDVSLDELDIETGDRFRFAVKVFPSWLSKEFEVDADEGIVFKSGSIKIKRDGAGEIRFKVRDALSVVRVK